MHTLYRFYAADSTLLYVGITNDPPRRFSKHRDEKDWWLSVARIEMEQYSSRDELAAAERTAIANEQPLHNIVHRSKEPNSPHLRLPLGLRSGEVYALGLDNGSCPVGLVVDGDQSGVTLELYSWMVELFTAGQQWVSAARIVGWAKAQKHMDGSTTVFEMDDLGYYQASWQRRHP